MAESSENPHMPQHPIYSLSDEMLQIQKDMEAIREGKMDDKTARNLLKGHGQILKGCDMQLQYRRINQGKSPETELPLMIQRPAIADGTK